MNILCGAIQNLWNEFYNNYVVNIDHMTKIYIGVGCIVVALVMFVLCTKGNNKAGLINHWFLFWISIIFLIVGVFYLTN